MPDRAIFIDLRLTGSGWAELELRSGHQSFTVDGVSYTTDALGDLLRAALMIATGAWSASVSFDGEPRESRLIAGNFWDAASRRRRFCVRVLEFADIASKQPDEEGVPVFEAECEARDFAAAVRDAARRLWEVGADGYRWRDIPFPLRALRALETALATKDPPVPPPDPNAPSLTIFSNAKKR
jgi:hypothetical protein